MINPFRRLSGRIAVLLPVFVLMAGLSSSSAAEVADIRYTGKLKHHERGEEPAVVKEFGLLSIVGRQDDSLQTLFWQVDHGAGWPWPESFGWSGPDHPKRQIIRDPGLLYDYDGQPWPIPFPPLHLPKEQREKGKSWMVDRLKYEVQTESKTFREEPAVTVLVTSNFGRAQELLYHSQTGMLQNAQVKLFLGRGDEFSLSLEQSKSNEISGSVQDKVSAALVLLKKMQGELDRGKRMTRPELSAEQITVVTSILPKLDELTENTPLQSLVIDIHRDLKSQQERQANVEQLSAQLVGQKAPELKLRLLNNELLEPETIEGKILVLHFWKYQDEPLQEPYGQVGYLDYLNGKRGKLGVKFLGVAVNSEFANPQSSRAMVLAVKKLVSFMNIGYDIVRDHGTLLKKFGDPRTSGASLPLWVVIGADGIIKHYKVGFYDVNPREGLKELDSVIIKEIKAKRAATSE